MIMVFEYMSEYIGMLLGALALLVLQAICDLSLPDYMSDIVDTGVTQRERQLISCKPASRCFLSPCLAPRVRSPPGILPPGLLQIPPVI